MHQKDNSKIIPLNHSFSQHLETQYEDSQKKGDCFFPTPELPEKSYQKVVPENSHDWNKQSTETDSMLNFNAVQIQNLKSEIVAIRSSLVKLKNELKECSDNYTQCTSPQREMGSTIPERMSALEGDIPVSNSIKPPILGVSIVESLNKKIFSDYPENSPKPVSIFPEYTPQNTHEIPGIEICDSKENGDIFTNSDSRSKVDAGASEDLNNDDKSIENPVSAPIIDYKKQRSNRQSLIKTQKDTLEVLDDTSDQRNKNKSSENYSSSNRVHERGLLDPLLDHHIQYIRLLETSIAELQASCAESNCIITSQVIFNLKLQALIKLLIQRNKEKQEKKPEHCIQQNVQYVTKSVHDRTAAMNEANTRSLNYVQTLLDEKELVEVKNGAKMLSLKRKNLEISQKLKIYENFVMKPHLEKDDSRKLRSLLQNKLNDLNALKLVLRHKTKECIAAKKEAELLRSHLSRCRSDNVLKRGPTSSAAVQTNESFNQLVGVTSDSINSIMETASEKIPSKESTLARGQASVNHLNKKIITVSATSSPKKNQSEVKLELKIPETGPRTDTKKKCEAKFLTQKVVQENKVLIKPPKSIVNSLDKEYFSPTSENEHLKSHQSVLKKKNNDFYDVGLSVSQSQQHPYSGEIGIPQNLNQIKKTTSFMNPSNVPQKESMIREAKNSLTTASRDELTFGIVPLKGDFVYKPDPDDKVDVLLSYFINSRMNKIIFTKVREGYYLFGRMPVAILKGDNSRELKVYYRKEQYSLETFVRKFEGIEFNALALFDKTSSSAEGLGISETASPNTTQIREMQPVNHQGSLGGMLTNVVVTRWNEPNMRANKSSRARFDTKTKQSSKEKEANVTDFIMYPQRNSETTLTGAYCKDAVYPQTAYISDGTKQLPLQRKLSNREKQIFNPLMYSEVTGQQKKLPKKVWLPHIRENLINQPNTFEEAFHLENPNGPRRQQDFQESPRKLLNSSGKQAPEIPFAFYGRDPRIIDAVGDERIILKSNRLQVPESVNKKLQPDYEQSSGAPRCATEVHRMMPFRPYDGQLLFRGIGGNKTQTQPSQNPYVFFSYEASPLTHAR